MYFGFGYKDVSIMKSPLHAFFTSLVLAIALLMCGHSVYASGFSLRVDPKGEPLNSEAIAALKEIFQEVELLLPQKLKTVIGKTVWVKVVSKPKKHALAFVRARRVKPRGKTKIYLNAAELIYSSGPSIEEIFKYLNKSRLFYFLEDVMAAPVFEQKLVYQKSLIKWALIHELAHLFDLSVANRSAIDKKELAACERYSKAGRECMYYKRMFYHSQSKQFLLLDNWRKKGKKSRNQQQEGYLRSYVRFSSHEAFAEYTFRFTIDPEFSCRMPAMYSYLSQVYQSKGAGECESPNHYVFHSKTGKRYDLNPKRIYQVHYLHAGKGEKIMSRWGHSMFRLVVCSPKRERVSRDCLKDVSHHVVISFRANVDDLVLNAYKGLTGGYHSKIYFLDFKEAKDDYTYNELREVYSLPLEYSRKDLKQFIGKAVEDYWLYQSKYYFFTNNCMSEAVRLALTPVSGHRQEQREWLKTRPVTPEGFFRRLKKSKNVNLGAIRSENREKDGYYFPPKQESLVQAFSVLKALAKQGGLAFPKKLRKYLDSKVEQRQRWFTQLVRRYKKMSSAERLQKREELPVEKNLNYVSLTDKERQALDLALLASAAFNLEKYIRHVYLESVKGRVGAYLRGEVEMKLLDSEKSDLIKRIEALRTEASQVALTWLLKNQEEYSYGVPLVNNIREGFEEQKLQQITSDGEFVKKLMEGVFLKEKEELKNLDLNMKLFWQQFRSTAIVANLARKKLDQAQATPAP